MARDAQMLRVVPEQPSNSGRARTPGFRLPILGIVVTVNPLESWGMFERRSQVERSPGRQLDVPPAGNPSALGDILGAGIGVPGGGPQTPQAESLGR